MVTILREADLKRLRQHAVDRAAQDARADLRRVPLLAFVAAIGGGFVGGRFVVVGLSAVDSPPAITPGRSAADGRRSR